VNILRKLPLLHTKRSTVLSTTGDYLILVNILRNLPLLRTKRSILPFLKRSSALGYWGLLSEYSSEPAVAANEKVHSVLGFWGLSEHSSEPAVATYRTKSATSWIFFGTYRCYIRKVLRCSLYGTVDFLNILWNLPLLHTESLRYSNSWVMGNHAMLWWKPRAEIKIINPFERVTSIFSSSNTKISKIRIVLPFIRIALKKHRGSLGFTI
jgi:hypothetical protein